ncbi:non-lysosomal glucosylceramidase-like [Amphiura filiformis]|uniref:non-lysosomal glucosylceramidase-like n=1 Tax=Amphiura filiformis TaxID=82378 RepID=UPI003B215AC3
MATTPSTEGGANHDSQDASPTTTPFSLETIGVPAYGWRVPLNHEFPEKWGPLGPKIRVSQAIHFIRSGIRYLKFRRKMKREGRMPFIDIKPVPFKSIYGVPIGGIGCGAINRGWKGDFCRWSLTPGIYTYNVVEANQFTVCVRRNGKTTYQQVLNPSSPKNKHLADSWKWGFPGDQSQYHALYPRAWMVYKLPGQNITLACRQISPILPQDYKDSSLPVGVFVWKVFNHNSEPVDVSIMFTWQNGTGGKDDRTGGRWNEPFNTQAEKEGDSELSGVLLHDNQSDQPCTFAVAATAKDGVKVSHCTSFDPEANSKELWDSLHGNGALQLTEGASEKTEKGRVCAAAVCVSCHVERNEDAEMEFVLAWDMPKIHFKTNTQSYYRRYCRWFGKDGKSAPTIASYALNNYKTWEEAIEQWQNPILHNESYPDWYKSALFNELYFISDGGTVWVETPEPSTEAINGHFKTYDFVKEYGRFVYLEGHEYRMFNTYDVHFYASFALLMLWPKLELSLQYDIGATVTHDDPAAYRELGFGKVAYRKVAGYVPHDVGDPEDEPWQHLNGYCFFDTSNWKDLNLKFVLLIYRDYYFTKDLTFLKEMFPKCLVAMEISKKFDIDDDGIIDNSGFPDQTYDAWTVTGASAYCGGLWLAAVKFLIEMAQVLGQEDDVGDYKDILEKGKQSYEKKLWNGTYYNYDSSGKSYHDSIMADQCAGHWFLRASNMVPEGQEVFPPDHVKTALKTVHKMNVMAFRDGHFGAVNGVRPNGKIDTTSLQGEEVWTGVTYGVAANMIQEGLVKEGFETAQGVYETCYERAGLGFQTPEGYMVRNVYRSSGYMRPLAIWAMQYALEKKHLETPTENGTE